MPSPKHPTDKTISIHGLRGEPDDDTVGTRFVATVISIHGLRGEPDCGIIYHLRPQRYFNPRAPRGARHNNTLAVQKLAGFQSTGSAGSPTITPCLKSFIRGNFNPRAPRGARPNINFWGVTMSKFQSTGSAGSPTRTCTYRPSIQGNFNPRAPRGARLLIFCGIL